MSPKQPRASQDVLSLLTQLKTTSKPYPPELLSARRSIFLKKAATLKINPKVLRGKEFAKFNSGLLSTLEVVMQSILGALVTIMVVSAVIVYREEIVDFFTPDDGSTISSEVAPLPFESTPSLTPSPFTPTALIPTIVTSLPRQLIPTATFTPMPDEPKPTEDENNPGKHLGQTPTPPAKRKTPKP